MSLALQWINGAADQWWQYIIHTSWQAAIVGAVLLAVVHWAGDRWPAPLRYALLVLALLKFVCPPLLSLPTGLFTHLPAPQTLWSTPPERKPTQATAPRGIDAPTETGERGLAWLGTRFQAAAAVLPHPPVSWTTCLMAAHLIGVGLIARGISREAARLRQLTRRSRRRLKPPLGDEYRDLAIQLGVYRIPALTICERAEAPMAFGVKRPSIVIPARIVRGLAPTELRAVLAHELAHCQRGDLWLVWIQVTIYALWWFHPVVWLVNRSLNQVREDCCDDMVLARGFISNDAYCDLLLRAASTSVTPVAALPFGDAQHPLGRRIARITDWTLARCERVSKAGALSVLLSAAVLLPGARLPTSPPVESSGTGLPSRPPELKKIAQTAPTEKLAALKTTVTRRQPPRLLRSTPGNLPQATSKSGGRTPASPVEYRSSTRPVVALASARSSSQPRDTVVKPIPAALTTRPDPRPSTPGVLTGSAANVVRVVYTGWGPVMSLGNPTVVARINPPARTTTAGATVLPNPGLSGHAVKPMLTGVQHR